MRRELLAASILVTLSACADVGGMVSVAEKPGASIISCNNVTTIVANEWDSPVQVNTSGHHATFTVTNQSDSTSAIALSCASDSQISCTGLSPSTFNLSAHTGQSVTATFSTSALGKPYLWVTGCNAIDSAGFIRVTS